eukprot:Sspe_Gene.27265::Locus_11661_Transcript_2_2_Confidence_0.250_Length_1622::g.27265::m.27265
MGGVGRVGGERGLWRGKGGEERRAGRRRGGVMGQEYIGGVGEGEHIYSSYRPCSPPPTQIRIVPSSKRQRSSSSSSKAPSKPSSRGKKPGDGQLLRISMPNVARTRNPPARHMVVDAGEWRTANWKMTASTISPCFTTPNRERFPAPIPLIVPASAISMTKASMAASPHCLGDGEVHPVLARRAAERTNVAPKVSGRCTAGFGARCRRSCMKARSTALAIPDTTAASSAGDRGASTARMATPTIPVTAETTTTAVSSPLRHSLRERAATPIKCTAPAVSPVGASPTPAIETTPPAMRRVCTRAEVMCRPCPWSTKGVREGSSEVCELPSAPRDDATCPALSISSRASAGDESVTSTHAVLTII